VFPKGGLSFPGNCQEYAKYGKHAKYASAKYGKYVKYAKYGRCYLLRKIKSCQETRCADKSCEQYNMQNMHNM
jgi:hypothetical protein